MKLLAISSVCVLKCLKEMVSQDDSQYTSWHTLIPTYNQLHLGQEMETESDVPYDPPLSVLFSQFPTLRLIPSTLFDLRRKDAGETPFRTLDSQYKQTRQDADPVQTPGTA